MGDGIFFRFLVSLIVFFFQPLTGLSAAVRVGRSGAFGDLKLKDQKEKRYIMCNLE